VPAAYQSRGSIVPMYYHDVTVGDDIVDPVVECLALAESKTS
jgi:hypothetical protein